jgi:hypothetical protein
MKEQRYNIMLLKNSNTTNDEDNNAYQELVLEITNEIIDIVVCFFFL